MRETAGDQQVLFVLGREGTQRRRTRAHLPVHLPHVDRQVALLGARLRASCIRTMERSFPRVDSNVGAKVEVETEVLGAVRTLEGAQAIVHLLVSRQFPLLSEGLRAHTETLIMVERSARTAGPGAGLRGIEGLDRKYKHETPSRLVIHMRSESSLSEDPSQVLLRPLLFCFPAEQQRPLEEVMSEESPVQCEDSADTLASWLERQRAVSSRLFDCHVAQRLQRKRLVSEVPSVLPQSVIPADVVPESLSQVSTRLAISGALSASRQHIFACPVFRDASTPSLRHTCLGVLVDAFKVHSRFAGDLQRVLERLGSRADLCVSEQLEFLRQLQANSDLSATCAYAVTSKTTTQTKRELRELYLQLLAVKHNTTPNQAQLLVPGFTYDSIQSIDAVLELVESRPEAASQSDAEVRRFRQRLSQFKSPSKKLRPLLSAAFLQKLEKLLSLHSM